MFNPLIVGVFDEAFTIPNSSAANDNLFVVARINSDSVVQIARVLRVERNHGRGSQACPSLLVGSKEYAIEHASRVGDNSIEAGSAIHRSSGEFDT